MAEVMEMETESTMTHHYLMVISISVGPNSKCWPNTEYIPDFENAPNTEYQMYSGFENGPNMNTK